MAENDKVSVEVEGGSTYDEVLKTGKYKLSRPYKFGDGPEQTVLNFPLKDMTGQHIRTAQANYERLEGHGVGFVAETDKTYQAHIVAALMDVQPDFVFDLPVKDFTRLTVFVERFLINSD